MSYKFHFKHVPKLNVCLYFMTIVKMNLIIFKDTKYNQHIAIKKKENVFLYK